MSRYTVISDVDAEDKLLGPLTFKQFIYAMIAGGCGMGLFFGFSASPFLAILFLPPMLLFLFLAFYRRDDQPAEAYLLSLLSTYFKPRTRIWNRDGLSEHVHINVPKIEEAVYDDGRTRAEIRGQLSQLSQLIDSRGWSSKHVTNQSGVSTYGTNRDDRLVQADFSVDQTDQIQERVDDPYDTTSVENARLKASVNDTTNAAKEKAMQNMRLAQEATKN